MDGFWRAVVLTLVLALVRFLHKKLRVSKRFPRFAIFVDILVYVLYCLALILLAGLSLWILRTPIKPEDGPIQPYAWGLLVLVLVNLPNLYLKTKALLARFKKKE